MRNQLQIIKGINGNLLKQMQTKFWLKLWSFLKEVLPAEIK